jgi:hypothetical protein
MSLAAEPATKSTSASSSAPPANMPAVLNREPSQQDLEIARQLQSFQSQAIPSHEASRTDANAQQTPKSLSEILSDSKPQPQPDDHSRNSQQPSPSPYPPAAQFTPLQQQQPQQRTPQSSSASGGGNGQICRYVYMGILLGASLTRVATVEPPRHHSGGALPPVLSFATPADSTTKRATRCDPLG